MEEQKNWTDSIEPMMDKVKSLAMISAATYCLYSIGAGICSLIVLFFTILAYALGAALFCVAMFYSYNAIYN